MNASFDQVLQFVLLLAAFIALAIMVRRMSGGPTIAAAEVRRRIEAGEDLLLLDVRTPQEFAESHIGGALNLPLNQLGPRLGTATAQLAPYRDTPVVVVCRSSARAHSAAKALRKAGLNKVLVMGGGMLAWSGRRFPVRSGR